MSSEHSSTCLVSFFVRSGRCHFNAWLVVICFFTCPPTDRSGQHRWYHTRGISRLSCSPGADMASLSLLGRKEHKGFSLNRKFSVALDFMRPSEDGVTVQDFQEADARCIRECRYEVVGPFKSFTKLTHGWILHLFNVGLRKKSVSTLALFSLRPEGSVTLFHCRFTLAPRFTPTPTTEAKLPAAAGELCTSPCWAAHPPCACALPAPVLF